MLHCHFCSVISKTNGVDPIGSAPTYDGCLMVEIAPPWPHKFWQAKPMLQPIVDLLEHLGKQGVKIGFLAIAPNRKYSQPDLIRVIYYYRPSQIFAQFEKQEFLLPETELIDCIKTLLKEPESLFQFEPYRQQTNQIRELIICTHGNLDVACSRFGYPIYKKLYQEYVPASQGQLRVWQASHIGGHLFAPTLVDFPEGRYWGHLESGMLDLLIYRQGLVTELKPFYRGWIGFNWFAQIAEREILMQEGWAWFDYFKSGKVLSTDETEEEWAEVQIDFMSKDGSISGAYEARVEVSGEVTVAYNSGKDKPLHKVKQYCVSRLTKVS
ncbi:sucrase ferredoxin [[Phormidium ambiguum] IAM M-71]|uniref:Sucrase ferredoxin n=1 Tax=[Phormidium ambiguum] IAM M-71 TaxID=454136 RepID=A0A1U7IL05_9CYAN|nr:sucrase ferredoxin [Phormidium ambiguum]OKH37855.1 sucrase ferredoxin [Phormidium ambiguum IAM M-71]